MMGSETQMVVEATSSFVFCFFVFLGMLVANRMLTSSSRNGIIPPASQTAQLLLTRWPGRVILCTALPPYYDKTKKPKHISGQLLFHRR